MTHTPGPWEWVPDRFNGGYSGIASQATGQEVLFPNHRNEGDDGDAWFEDFPSEADKHLIAAAPDLLEALEAIREDFKFCSDVRGILASKADAAIAKAKGETP